MAELTVEQIRAEIANALETTRSDFEGEIDRVQAIVQNIDWWEQLPEITASEVGPITFQSYQEAKDLIEGINFSPLSQEDLIDNNMERYKQHMFLSGSLDDAEGVIVDNIASAGLGEMKELTGVFLGDVTRNVLIAGQEKHDLSQHNSMRALQQLYSTPDDTGNINWLDQQYQRKVADRRKNIFYSLFDLAQQNVEWCFKTGIQIEVLHKDFTSRYNRLFYDITRANIAAYKAEVRANIANFEGKLKQAVAEVQVEELKYDRDSAEWALRISQANSRVSEFIQDYRGTLATNNALLASRMQGGANVAEAYKNIFGSFASQFTGLSLNKANQEEES